MKKMEIVRFYRHERSRVDSSFGNGEIDGTKPALVRANRLSLRT